MTTNEALEKLLSLDATEVCDKLEISTNTFYTLRSRFNKKKLISEENMKAMLLKFGFTIVKDISWRAPK